MGKLIAAFIDARGYRIILAVQIKSSYDNRPAFVKLLIKNGCNLIEHDTVASFNYFFFGLRLLTRFATPLTSADITRGSPIVASTCRIGRFSTGSMQNSDMGSIKGHGSATAV